VTAQLHRSDRSVVENLVYREVVGFRPLELDLYLPPTGDRSPPVVVFLHGGGWQRGSRRQTLPVLSDLQPTLFERITAAGFAVAAADYRLSGEAVFPAPADDVRVAAAWLREHATDLGLDGGPVYLWGESAGAHLALLVAMSDEIGGHDDVAGVVAWFPPTDLLGLDADAAAVGGEPHSPADSRESRLLGASVTDVPKRARAASPLSHVRGDAPPTLLMHGDADLLVPAAQSIRLAEALRQVGARVQLEIVPGAGHMWTDCADPAAVVERSLAFLRGLRQT
jgi:acetyl esterase/lipase